MEAPGNVLYDEDGVEFVWLQPRTTEEVVAVYEAAWMDPFGGYGRDGHQHWTQALVREWWAGLEHQRQRIDRAVRAPEVLGDPSLDRAVALARQRWSRYLGSHAMALDLRRYLFRLSEGRYPTADEHLPAL